MKQQMPTNEPGRSAPPCPNLMIVTRQFGASGQPWIWRQVSGIQGFKKQVVWWKRENTVSQPRNDFEEFQISGDPAPYDNRGRWLHRSRTAMSGNFYASVGKERRQIAELMAQLHPGVILCYFGDMAMRLLPVALEQKVPLVAYLHGDFLFKTNRWYRWSLRACLEHFAAVVVVTNAERDWLLKHGVPSHKIHVVPCGAPISVFHPVRDLGNSELNFIMASRLAEEKGCHLSIAAFSKFLKIFPAARLSVFGDGPQRSDLEQLVAKLNLTNRVIFHGYVGQLELAHQMAKHDIFIQHSLRKEGSPVSIVEAMSCGLPTISTPVGGISDLVIDKVTGLLIDEGDVGRMASSMALLAADEDLRRKYGNAAMERAASRFNSDIQTEILQKILEGACVRAARTFV
ncbi:hypothetical protein ASD36_16630 [Rhizobium sp. Root1334]|nr:hypothetical protein ASC96_20655 [Rhizobium sp. Root1204]KQY02763.1 hypothetical protein ASD36_16630 [Rhizobium sp. Root1334]